MTEVLIREGETAASGGEPNAWLDRNGRPIDLLEIKEHGHLDGMDGIAASVADNSEHVKELASTMTQEDINQLRAAATAETSRIVDGQTQKRLGLLALATEVQIESWRQKPYVEYVPGNNHIEHADNTQDILGERAGVGEGTNLAAPEEPNPIGATEWHRTKKYY